MRMQKNLQETIEKVKAKRKVVKTTLVYKCCKNSIRQRCVCKYHTLRGEPR
jgi:hypothetical protein